ncbi:MAG: hypothetical protein C4541_11480 [Candidatus Auribacter fodinae]|uniref:Apea-like HEPN domain-containing protein n=1 Tax=Candidatus Auribacter fodinae TaxID=2093366 RepID=A0A3A4R3G3_9BACT|nr:MAG: hypothetical protein C4541_11480 [Candidatus Auribacter fodinae]
MCEDTELKYDEFNDYINQKLAIFEMNTRTFLEDRKFIFYFAVIWSIFENICCDCYAKIENVYHSGEISDFEESLLDKTWQYFRQRYITNGKTNLPFDQIWEKTEKVPDEENTFKSHKKTILNEQKKKTADILKKSTSPDKNEKVKALICIIFRLRNRLFHGEKALTGITSQEETFIHASKFLIECIRREIKIIAPKKSPAS